MTRTLSDVLQTQGIELRSHSLGQHSAVCPKCSHDRHKRKQKCLSVLIKEEGIVWNCHHCGDKGASFLTEYNTKTEPAVVERSEFNLKTLDVFTEAGSQFWLQYGIGADTLKEHNVYQLVSFSTLNAEGEPYTINADKVGGLMFAYVIGPSSAKVYMPKRAKGPRWQWLGSKPNNWYFGYRQLPQQHELCVLAAGEKDTLALCSLGLPAICLNSETITELPKQLEQELKARFRKIVILYDNDKTGQTNGRKLAKAHNLYLADLPALAHTNVKDISDYLANKGGIPELQEAIHRARRVSTPTGELIDYLSTRYAFRWNCVTDRTEFKALSQPSFKELNDRDLNSIWLECTDTLGKVSFDNLARLIHSDHTPTYDPLKSWLESLPEWDGVDYIGELTDTVGMLERDVFRRYFTKWLVASVASIYEERANHTALIFSGAQGIGKTSWLNTLLPKELRRYTFAEALNVQDKDSRLRLSDCWFINLDELETLDKSDLGELKSIITQELIYVRAPYERSAKRYPRRASFCGSVNETEFLTDSTGNRRFLVFEALHFDLKTAASIDRTLVFAQALALYRQGFQYHFDTEEIDQLNQRNEQFRVQAPVEELAQVFIHHPTTSASNRLPVFLNATQLLHYLGQQVGGKLNMNQSEKKRLGAWLKRNGFEIKTKRQSGEPQKVYEVILLQADAAQV